MSVKVFLVLGFVACASQAFQLTKENNLAQKPELQNQLLSLKESAFSLGDQQVRQKVFNEIVAAPKAAVINVAQLLQKSANPEVSEVLDDFNDGLGFKVLAIEGEYVVLDSVAFENLLSQKARSISKAVNPNNYYQELIMFGTMQKKILELSPEIRAATQATKVPVSSFAGILTGKGVAQRDIAEVESKNFMEVVFSVMEITVCNVLVEQVYGQVNTTLQSYNTYLSSISIASSDEVSAVIQAVIDLGKSLISYINSLASSLTSTICEDIFSSDSDSETRKRRDLSAASIDVEGKQVALTNRSIITDVLDLLWSLLAPVLNSIFKLILNTLTDNLLTEVTSVINVVKAALELVIDDIFS